VRQSAAEIDHAILDVAAGIFATHGYTHSSVQQIADAVGYSKPGLLHRVGSKEALHRAVLAEVAEIVQELAAHATAHADRPDQLARVLELLTRKALDRPGMVRMMIAALHPGCEDPGIQAVQGAGYRLVSALDHPLGDPVARLRLVLALELVVTAAVAQRSPLDAHVHVEREELVPLLVSLASQVVGAGDPVAGGASSQ